MVTYDDSTLEAVVEAMRLLNKAEAKFMGALENKHRIKIALEFYKPDMDNAKKVFDEAVTIMATTVQYWKLEK